jgi:hypothetical protein
MCSVIPARRRIIVHMSMCGWPSDWSRTVPPKTLMPLWLNGFSCKGRCLIKDIRLRLSSTALDAFCQELKSARKELALLMF